MQTWTKKNCTSRLKRAREKERAEHSQVHVVMHRILPPLVPFSPPPALFLSLHVWMLLTPESPAVCALPSSVSAFYDCYLHLQEQSV